MSSVVSGHPSLDAANADLQLLNQNLSLSRKVSTQATLQLSSFDDRLARLEKTVLAVHRDLLPVQRVNANVTALLEAIESALGQSSALQRDEATILNGPNAGNIAAYQDSLARLVDQYEQGKRSSSKDSDLAFRRLNKALEDGTKQLGQVALGWVKEASPPDLQTLSRLPPATLDRLTTVFSFINAMPQDSPGISSAQRELERSFGTIRGSAVATCLTSMGQELLKQSKATPASAKGIESLVDALLSVVKSELAVISHLFPPQHVPPILDAFCSTSLPALQDAGYQINNMAKRSVTTLGVLAFRSYAGLEARKPAFQDQIRLKANRKQNELADIARVLRATCLTSLPEFLAEIKAWGAQTVSPTDAPGRVDAMTQHTIAFMQHLSDNQTVAEKLLQTLGDGNWNMSNKMASATVTPKLPTDLDGLPLSEKYLGDLMSALLSALDNKAQLLRSTRGQLAGTAPIWLLNNMAYVRQQVLHSNVVLGERAEDELNRRQRTAKTTYLEVFGGLVSALMDGGLSVGARSAAGSTDKFAKFNEALADVERVHRLAQIDPGERDMKARLGSEVDKMVMPTYRAFAGRNGVAPSRTRILTPDEVSERLNALFR